MFVLGNVYVCPGKYIFFLGNDRNENLKSSGYCPVFALSATLTVGHKFCTLIYIDICKILPSENCDFFFYIYLVRETKIVTEQNLQDKYNDV